MSDSIQNAPQHHSMTYLLIIYGMILVPTTRFHVSRDVEAHIALMAHEGGLAIPLAVHACAAIVLPGCHATNRHCWRNMHRSVSAYQARFVHHCSIVAAAHNWKMLLWDRCISTNSTTKTVHETLNVRSKRKPIILSCQIMMQLVKDV